MKLFKILMVMGVLAFGTIANAALVDPLQLDFADGADSGGTLEEVTAGDIHGTDIFIGSLTIIGSAGYDGEYVVDALLNFDTSANTLSIVGTAGGLDPSLSGTGITLFEGDITSFDWTTVHTLTFSLQKGQV